MGEAYRSKVLKSGNSVALRLPKALGIAQGTEMSFREERGSFILEPFIAPRRKRDVSAFWGKAPDARPLTRGEREFDERPSTLTARKNDYNQ